MEKKLKKYIKFLARINFILKKNKLILPNQKLLIAFSGGQDSSCLLYILFILKKQWKLQIVLLYCNHLWQEDSLFTFFQVSKLVYSLNLSSSYFVNLNVKMSELQGRNFRLKNYIRLLDFETINIVTTGHTKSDQIETFFFNFLRGSGLTGLFSMKLKKDFFSFQEKIFSFSKNQIPKLQRKTNKSNFVKTVKKGKPKNLNTCQQETKKKVYNKLNKKVFTFKADFCQRKQIIRPLLLNSRIECLQFCKQVKLPIFPDSTNQEFFYTRNRIRKQIIPTLSFFFNPQLEEILSKNNLIIMNQEEFFLKLLNKLYIELISFNKNYYCLNRSFFYSLPFSIQQKICIYFFNKILLIETNFDFINNFIFLLNNKMYCYQKKKVDWVFFPKVGILFFYKNVILFYF